MEINQKTKHGFFNATGQALNLTSWCVLYRASYFLGGPDCGLKITSRNQTSAYIEGEAIRILNQPQPLNQQDLKFIFGWKLDQIDHQASELKHQIVYRPAWNQHLIASMRFDVPDFFRTISSLAAEMPHIQTLQPEAVFDLHRGLANIGPVYILTLLFFLSHGQWPIYDKYAAIAAEAITRSQLPGSSVHVPELSSWKRYQEFVNKISGIFGCQGISREQDQALWVYGHFFKT